MPSRTLYTLDGELNIRVLKTRQVHEETWTNKYEIVTQQRIRRVKRLAGNCVSLAWLDNAKDKELAVKKFLRANGISFSGSVLTASLVALFLAYVKRSKQ